LIRLCLPVLWVVGGCVFDWPPATKPTDGAVDAGADTDGQADADRDAFCDAGGRTCGVCGLSCGPHATCAHDAGQCVCGLGYQDCNADPWSDGCESWLSFDSAHWTFYSTLDDIAAVQNPVHGPAANPQNLTGADFVTGVIENGVRIDSDSSPLAAIEVPNDIPGQPVFDTAQGAIRFWYQPNYFHDVNHQVPLMRCDGQGSSFEITHTAEGHLYIKFHRDAGADISMTLSTSQYSWSPGQWVLIDLRWTEGDTWSLRLNDAELANLPFGTLEGFAPCGSIYVGAGSGGMHHADGVIDEIMFFHRADYTLETVCPQ
jgi:hypothetical protein